EQPRAFRFACSHGSAVGWSDRIDAAAGVLSHPPASALDPVTVSSRLLAEGFRDNSHCRPWLFASSAGRRGSSGSALSPVNPYGPLSVPMNKRSPPTSNQSFNKGGI